MESGDPRAASLRLVDPAGSKADQVRIC